MNSQFNLLNETAPTQRRVNKKVVGLVLLAVAAVAAIACVSAPRTTEVNTAFISQDSGVESWVNEAFQKWSVKNDKVYGSSDEKNYRVLVFRQNLFRIKQFYEEGQKSFTLGLNEFADLTQEEFRAKYLTLNVKKVENKVKTLSTENLPESVNWVEQGAVNTVKDQAQCGSCWAFSTIAAVEALHAIQTKELVRFSEQQLVDCAGGEYGNQGCNGGLMDPSFQYIIDNGIELESNYPYRGVDQKCKASQAKSAWTFAGYTDVAENDNDQLRAAAAQQVVSVAIEVNFEFQFYSGGVFEGDSSCGDALNHGVAVVGYGSSNGSDYWLVRNSWGGRWGDSGYIKMARQSGVKRSTCGIASMASYPTA